MDRLGMALGVGIGCVVGEGGSGLVAVVGIADVEGDRSRRVEGVGCGCSLERVGMALVYAVAEGVDRHSCVEAGDLLLRSNLELTCWMMRFARCESENENENERGRLYTIRSQAEMGDEARWRCREIKRGESERERDEEDRGASSSLIYRLLLYGYSGSWK